MSRNDLSPLRVCHRRKIGHGRSAIRFVVRLVVLLTTLTCGATAWAAFGVSPPWVRDSYVKVGTTFSQILSFSTDSPSQDGFLDWRLDGTDATFLSWITVDLPSHSPWPAGQTRFPLTVSVSPPAAAAVGSYRAGIFTTYVVPPAPDCTSGCVGISLGAHILVDITVTADDHIDYSVRSAQLGSPCMDPADPIRVNLSINNLGNTDIARIPVVVDVIDSVSSSVVASAQSDAIAPGIAAYKTAVTTSIAFASLGLAPNNPNRNYWADIKVYKDSAVTYENRLYFLVKHCVASDACHTAGTCDSSGVCSNPAKPERASCDDGNACTQSDICIGGVCAGTAYTCAAPDQCHNATCKGDGTCAVTAKTNGTTCNDGIACTRNDVCTAGVCAGAAYTCADPDRCHEAGTCNGDGTCTFALKTNVPVTPEDCGNGSDDDCDGLVDCADPDCATVCAGQPEKTAEPPRDASGHDSRDAGQDVSVATATGTSTATGTLTTTNTHSATETQSNTDTRTAAEPPRDAGANGPLDAGRDVPVSTTSDASTAEGIPSAAIDASVDLVGTYRDASPRDEATVFDARSSAADAPIIMPTYDASGVVLLDTGLAVVDASGGGRGDALATDQRYGPMDATNVSATDAEARSSGKSSGGCGCVVGGAGTDRPGLWPLAFLVLPALRGVRRHRRERSRTRL